MATAASVRNCFSSQFTLSTPIVMLKSVTSAVRDNIYVYLALIRWFNCNCSVGWIRIANSDTSITIFHNVSLQNYKLKLIKNCERGSFFIVCTYTHVSGIDLIDTQSVSVHQHLINNSRKGSNDYRRKYIFTEFLQYNKHSWLRKTVICHILGLLQNHFSMVANERQASVSNVNRFWV